VHLIRCVAEIVDANRRSCLAETVGQDTVLKLRTAKIDGRGSFNRTNILNLNRLPSVVRDARLNIGKRLSRIAAQGIAKVRLIAEPEELNGPLARLAEFSSDDGLGGAAFGVIVRMKPIIVDLGGDTCT
jgi:hypothetical protein